MSYYADSEYVADPNTPWFKVFNLIPEKSKVLDIGCSSGNFGEILIKEKQATVDGIELDKTDAQLAAKKLRKVLNLDVGKDSFEGLDHDYNVVYMGDVIEHLVNPSHVLKKVKSLLAKDGFVIFSIPNMAHISVRLMLLSGRFEYGNTGLLDKTHLHYYDKSEIERVFSEGGYEIKELDWVSRDIPQELLIRELEKIGLQPNEKFFSLAKSLEAGAYQFIGKAIPTSKVEIKKLPTISPEIDMFEKHLADIRKSYEDDVNRLQKDYNEKLNQYESSASWKVTKPLRKVSKIVHKKQTS